MEWMAIGLGVLLLLILIEETGQYIWRNRFYAKYVSQEDTPLEVEMDSQPEPLQKPSPVYRLKQGVIRTFFQLMLISVIVLRMDKVYRFLEKRAEARRIKAKNPRAGKFSFKHPLAGVKHTAIAIKRYKKSSSL
ncbi:hypothetical protein A8F94_22100 [Bacillus sp. FJAT-27225]|uniref:hypothetical protein n=1 Tax=Bacillus sp. FJAT-27225 TaxID=1743144 RepID=UPI00080C2EF7|nr:hypothetical protein [Bacillus sp. FJAT-27225]OCA81566.1 hypothetical protein A8F94_22100 [Bacillus sp. FJAT-27225]